jgi:fructose-1,6-bisphosphatase II
VAVDPIDGTRLVARGEANALSVVAVAGRGTMFDPGPCVYMEKIAVGPRGSRAIDITAPIEDNLRNVATACGMEVRDLTVTILDRESALMVRFRGVSTPATTRSGRPRSKPGTTSTVS